MIPRESGLNCFACWFSSLSDPELREKETDMRCLLLAWKVAKRRWGRRNGD